MYRYHLTVRVTLLRETTPNIYDTLTEKNGDAGIFILNILYFDL